MPDPTGAPTREQVFAWMRETGSGAKAAAAAWGVSLGTIKSWMNRHGNPRVASDEGCSPSLGPALATPAEPRARAPEALPPGPPTPTTPPPARPPPPRPKPNSAELLAPDDRARLVAHVRSLQARLEKLDAAAQRELDSERPDAKAVDAYTRSASATAAEMERVLSAHPGLMAIVDADANTDGAQAAEQIEGFLGRLA